MARKVIKHIKPKGERLGWAPLDQVKHVSLAAIVVKGHRVTVQNPTEQQVPTPYLIP